MFYTFIVWKIYTDLSYKIIRFVELVYLDLEVLSILNI